MVLENVSFPVKKNAITAIIGPSGSGKTTLLRTINRLHDENPLARIEGEIFLDGTNILDKKVDATVLRTRIGMVFQKPNPFPGSIFDNVTFGPRLFGIKDRQLLEHICEDSLKKAGLWKETKDRLNVSAYALSGGQQQRLCIARAIAMQPEIILFDEPTSALDPASTFRIEELMLELKEEFTIVIVTHNMQQAARISDYIAFLYPDENLISHLIEYGTTSKIFVSPEKELTEKYISGLIG